MTPCYASTHPPSFGCIWDELFEIELMQFPANYIILVVKINYFQCDSRKLLEV